MGGGGGGRGGVQSGLAHPNIVRVVGAFHEEERLSIVMEWVRGGDLFDAICRSGAASAGGRRSPSSFSLLSPSAPFAGESTGLKRRTERRVGKERDRGWDRGWAGGVPENLTNSYFKSELGGGKGGGRVCALRVESPRERGRGSAWMWRREREGGRDGEGEGERRVGK